MNISRECPISEEQIRRYNEYHQGIQYSLEKTDLPDLVCVLLQTYKECQENKELFSRDISGQFAGEVMAKLINESWGFVGCMEHGAVSASFHHARACLELVAQFYWVNYKPSKKEKRLEKFFEYKSLSQYQSVKKSESKLTLHQSLIGKYDESDKNRWEENLSKWCDIYGVKDKVELLKVNRWQYPATINNMITETPGGDNIALVYDIYSKATHLSPDTIKLAGKSVIGLPKENDPQSKVLSILIKTKLATYQMLFDFINEFLGYNFKVKFPPSMKLK